MPKELLTRNELAAWITAELHKIEDYQGCSVTQILSLLELDEDGCNWSADHVIVNHGADVSIDSLCLYLNKFVAEAKSRFNLK
jgi:hypothetical protein